MRYLFFPSLLVLCLLSCKKDPVPVNPDPTPAPQEPKEPLPTTSTNLELIADSVFLFSKEIYYWKDTIGSRTYKDFNPRQYVATDEVATAKAVMTAVRNLSYWDKTKRFSYAEAYVDGTNSSKKASVETGSGFEFEFAWKSRKIHTNFYENDPDFAGYYVSVVDPNSDAGKKGIVRGMRILALNNKVLGFNQTDYGNLFNAVFATAGTNQYRFIRNIDGVTDTTDNITITAGTYNLTPILHHSIITTPKGEQAGYLSYNIFDRLADSRSGLDAVFSTFRSAGVKNIILDLRYNRGGYTTTQDYLTNNLAPNTATGLMYRYEYNSNLTTGNYSVLKSRYPNYLSFTTGYNSILFNASGSLNPGKVYIIVGPETASSSELLINNLKPVFGNNLVLIGNGNTYGKSVGFFPIDLFKKVTFWTVSFMTKNRNNDSVAYTGFKPHYLVYDGIDKAWGDLSEDCIAAAIKLMDGETVVSSVSPTSTRSVQGKPELRLMRKEESLLDNMLLEQQ